MYRDRRRIVLACGGDGDSAHCQDTLYPASLRVVGSRRQNWLTLAAAEAGFTAVPCCSALLGVFILGCRTKALLHRTVEHAGVNGVGGNNEAVGLERVLTTRPRTIWWEAPKSVRLPAVAIESCPFTFKCQLNLAEWADGLQSCSCWKEKCENRAREEIKRTC